MDAVFVHIPDADYLDSALQTMNDAGINPDFPFIDAKGNASIAHGMSPSGDDWAVGFEAPRNPDTGTEHCCRCWHMGAPCDAGAGWEPTYPLVGIAAVGGPPL